MSVNKCENFMDGYLQANRKLWDNWTAQHEQSPFYDLAGFRAGKDRLRSIELQELGDVAGKSLLHLQCHFGLDTLAWARRGATVTGVDFSEQSIALARSLSQELNIPARFCCSDIEHLPDVLSGEFDIVFTSYGVLPWLRELRRWGEVIAHFLKPGGIFYIVEDHPFMRIFTADAETEVKVANPYFFAEAPNRLESDGSYAAPGTGQAETFYIWDHSLGDVINALIAAGLRLEFLHEFPYAARAKFPSMQKGDDNWWRLSEQRRMIPLLFSLQARK
jgi:SAM-dependent methyltransferase